MADFAGFLKAARLLVPKERVYTDPLRRFAWGTDGSFYRLTPKLVVRAADEAEVSAVLAEAFRDRTPVTFRAAGTPAVPLYNRPYRGGIAEDYVSKRGVMRTWCELTGKPWPDGQTVKDVALSPEGKEVFARTGAYLAEAAAPLLEELGIECLLLGGQIAKSFGLMEASLKKGLSGVPALRLVSALPNLDTATFDGLKALL